MEMMSTPSSSCFFSYHPVTSLEKPFSPANSSGAGGGERFFGFFTLTFGVFSRFPFSPHSTTPGTLYFSEGPVSHRLCD